MLSLNDEDRISMYSFLVYGRAIENMLSKVAVRWHTGAGEEAVVVGTFFNLPKTDVVAPHYRGSLIVYFMRGASLRTLFAGVLGKKTSHTGGRIISKCAPREFNALGWLNENVGPQIYLGTGAALASKLMETHQVVIVSFGDGTTSRGEFHESINLASVQRLPAVFVCQNNQYAISMPASRAVAGRSVADRAIGYGIPGVEVNGNDVLAVHEAVQGAIQRARAGEGPTLIDARTYRVGPHFIGDPQNYRLTDQNEIEKWKKMDPIDLFQEKLLQSGVLTLKQVGEIGEAVEHEVSAAMKQAEADPLPSEDSLGVDDVFAPAKQGEEKWPE